MTTTVKVTAHNHPCIVKVFDRINENSYLMMDGVSREFTVTNSQSVEVRELDAVRVLDPPTHAPPPPDSE